jgi:hypothetical protein
MSAIGLSGHSSCAVAAVTIIAVTTRNARMLLNCILLREAALTLRAEIGHVGLPTDCSEVRFRG